MSEIHNPNLQIKMSGRGASDAAGIRSMLVTILLGVLFFFSYQGIIKSTSSIPARIQQSQTQARQAKEQPRSSQLQSPITVAHAAADSVRSIEPQNKFGLLTFIAQPLYLALLFLYEHGIGNWGWAIIILTVLFNLLLIGPRILSVKSSLKMMRIQPKVEALKKRYAHLKINDPKRDEMNAELMALYKAEGVSMYGNCLPMVLQMPLLFAYFRVLQYAPELHHAHWFWLSDLSLPDPLHILPIFIIVSMCLTQYMTPTPGMDSNQRRMLAILVPVAMGFTLWRYASGLALYWATGNLVSLILQVSVNCSKTGKEMCAIAAKSVHINAHRTEER